MIKVVAYNGRLARAASLWLETTRGPVWDGSQCVRSGPAYPQRMEWNVRGRFCTVIITAHVMGTFIAPDEVNVPIT